MVGVGRALLDAVVQVDNLADLAPRSLDPHPVALFQTKLGGVGGVHLEARVGPQLAAPGELTVLGVEVDGLTGTGRHDEGGLGVGSKGGLVAFLVDHVLVLFHLAGNGLVLADLVDQGCVVELRVGDLGVLRLTPVRELVLVVDVGLDDRGPDLHLGGGGHEAGLLVDGGVQVVATLLTTIAHLPATVGAPALGVVLAAVEPALFLELGGVLLEGGAVGELGRLPSVAGSLQNAGLLLLVGHGAAALDEVLDVEVEPLVVGRVGVVERHAHGLVEKHDEHGVEDALALGLLGALAGAEDAACTLRDARGVDLEPVQAGEHDVGAAVVGAAPQVDVNPEVKLGESLPGLGQVGLVHEVARHAHAGVNLVGRVDFVDGVPDGGGVGPTVPVAQQREALGADLLGVALPARLGVRPSGGGTVRAALALGDPAGLLVGGNLVVVTLGQGRVVVDQVLDEVLDLGDLVLDGLVAALPRDGVLAVVGGKHRGATGAAVDLSLGGTAVAGRLVGVARDAGNELQGAGVLDGVAGLVGSELVVDTAVAHGRVDTGRVGLHGLLDELGRDLGDLLGVLKGVGLEVLGEGVPHGAGDMLAAVLPRDLDLAREERRELGQTLGVALLGTGREAVRLGGGVGEGRDVGQPCVGSQRLVGVLDPHAGGGDAMLLALPLAGLGIPVGEALVGLVPDHEALGGAVLLEVGLGEQAGPHVDAAVHLHEPNAVAGLALLLLVLAPQERGVGPTAHEGVIVGLVVDDPLQPGQRQAQVGADTQGQPDGALLAQRGQTRVDQDVAGCVLRNVGDGTVVGVVVGVLSGGAPLHVDLGLSLDLHPRGADLVGQDAAEVTRALADLIGKVSVGRAEDLLEGSVGGLGPDAGGAAHGEDRLAAVLVDDLGELLAHEVEALLEGDADPARIVLALGVGALHGVTQAIGMVGGLHRSLGLRAAVAAAVRRGLVALDLDDLAVLNSDPNAALDLTAGAAGGTDALDLASGLVGTLRERLHGLGGAPGHGAGGGRDGGDLDEATAAHAELGHIVLLSSFLHDVCARVHAVPLCGEARVLARFQTLGAPHLYPLIPTGGFGYLSALHQTG